MEESTEKGKKLNPEMGRLIAENTSLKEKNAALKETNQMLSDMVDNLDRALTDMTALQRVSTENLNKASEIIKSVMPPENANPEMERLIAENRALKEENATLKARVTELGEITDSLAKLADEYDRELNASTDELIKTTDALKDAMAPKVRGTVT